MRLYTVTVKGQDSSLSRETYWVKAPSADKALIKGWKLYKKDFKENGVVTCLELQSERVS